MCGPAPAICPPPATTHLRHRVSQRLGPHHPSAGQQVQPGEAAEPAQLQRPRAVKAGALQPQPPQRAQRPNLQRGKATGAAAGAVGSPTSSAALQLGDTGQPVKHQEEACLARVGQGRQLKGRCPEGPLTASITLLSASCMPSRSSQVRLADRRDSSRRLAAPTSGPPSARRRLRSPVRRRHTAAQTAPRSTSSAAGGHGRPGMSCRSCTQ